MLNRDISSDTTDRLLFAKVWAKIMFFYLNVNTKQCVSGHCCLSANLKNVKHFYVFIKCLVSNPYISSSCSNLLVSLPTLSNWDREFHREAVLSASKILCSGMKRRKKHKKETFI